MIKNKYRHSTRDEDLVKEIAELEAAAQPTPPELPATTPAEETWQKRYSDLRKHSQTREDAMKAELEGIRRQLADATKQEFKFPTSDDDLEAWARKYPDVAKIVDTYAMKRAKEMSAQLEDRLKVIDEKEHQSTRRQAYMQLLEAHADFEEIAASEAFQDWVEAQPKYIYDALYVNETDARAAIRAVDLYKADTKPAKKPAASGDKDAARAIRTPASNSPDRQEEGWSESKMNKLNSRDLEKYMPEIDDAIRAGKFVYDLSGAAR